MIIMLDLVPSISSSFNVLFLSCVLSLGFPASHTSHVFISPNHISPLQSQFFCRRAFYIFCFPCKYIQHPMCFFSSRQVPSRNIPGWWFSGLEIAMFHSLMVANTNLYFPGQLYNALYRG